MSTLPHIGAAELPCPRCGYDLRATATVEGKRRCPECGTLASAWGAGGLTASRIPWLHRRRRGRVRMFVATIWMALVTPWRLAAQTTTPARFRDARRFRFIIVLMSTLIASAFLAYAVKEWDSNDWDIRFNSDTFAPALLLSDRWYGMIPLLASFYAANVVCLSLYRWIVPLGARPRHVKRRLRALSYYASSFLLVGTLAAILAACCFNAWLKIDHHHHHDTAQMVLALITCGIGVASYLLANFSFIFHARLRALLLLLYPAVAIMIGAAIVIAINWAVGYLILGIRSMM